MKYALSYSSANNGETVIVGPFGSKEEALAARDITEDHGYFIGVAPLVSDTSKAVVLLDQEDPVTPEES